MKKRERGKENKTNFDSGRGERGRRKGMGRIFLVKIDLRGATAGNVQLLGEMVPIRFDAVARLATRNEEFDEKAGVSLRNDGRVSASRSRVTLAALLGLDGAVILRIHVYVLLVK